MMRRSLEFLGVLWLAASLAFVALRWLPGDAIRAQYSEAGSAIVAARRDELGLNDPLPVQYGRFWLHLLRGDLGDSLVSRRPVAQMIGERIGPTLALTAWALVVAISVGIISGILAATENRLLAAGVRLVIGLALSMPIYWTATLVVFVLGGRLGGGDTLGVAGAVLGGHAAASIARLIQTQVADVYRADYVRTAHAKGLPHSVILRRHVLRVALLPVLNIIALQAGFLFSGAVITESIFQRPGLGLLLLDAVLGRDYPVVQGVVLVTAGIVISLNATADLLTRLIDPRLSL